MANDAAGCPWQSSCKSPRTLQKCKLLITKQLTFGAVLGEHKLSSPSTRLKVNHLCIRYLCIKSARGDFLEGHSYASRCHFSLFPSTKTPILCSGGLVCALSTGQQPAGNQKKTVGNQKKTAGNQNTPHQPPETNRLVSKKSAGATRWSAGRPLYKYSDCGLLEFVAVHGDEELLVIDCLLQSVLHKFHSLYAIHIRQVVAQYPYSVYILRTVEKIISTGRT